MKIPEELLPTLLSVAKVTVVIIGLALFLTFMSLVFNRETKKDYSDQDGAKNVKRYALGFIVMIVVVFIVGYALFFGGII